MYKTAMTLTGERDMTDKRKKRSPKSPKKNTSKPALQREGKVYVGGRALRRAQKKLSARQNAHASLKNAAGQRKPGSMSK